MERLERLGVVVHEVRSPVAALAAIAEAFGASSPEERRTLARLSVTAARATERLVLDAAVASVELEDVDLLGLVEDASAAARLAGSVVQVVGEARVTVQADPVRLRQALDNLLTNAARHASGSDIAVGIEHADGFVSVSVADSGPGIPDDDRARVFEPGVRIGGSQGSGLGLPVARAIAEAHGGTLTVASQPGAGSTFTLTLRVVAET